LNDTAEAIAGTSISCLMVTTLPLPERLAKKTLIVVINGCLQPVREALRAYIATLSRPDIYIVEPYSAAMVQAFALSKRQQNRSF
jgi:hypothetical protein